MNNKGLKKIGIVIGIISAINAIFVPILALYIEYKINKAIFPIQIELKEIQTNYKIWIKQGQVYRQGG